MLAKPFGEHMRRVRFVFDQEDAHSWKPEGLPVIDHSEPDMNTP